VLKSTQRPILYCKEWYDDVDTVHVQVDCSGQLSLLSSAG